MAHEKLSPRQKMIGMMYLILTAMLALNVSKEAVEAFKKVDRALTQTVANYAIKNNLIYKEFDRAAAENPTKAGKFKTTAFQVKERSDEAFNFIQDLKIKIINTAEGADNLAVKGDEITIEAVKMIDNTDVPTQILIGANEGGEANTLKALLNEYREFLITTLDGKNKVAEEALKTSLNTDNGKEKDGQTVRWETMTFQTMPLVAVICILSELQLSVRNGETEVLNYLYSQIDASSYKFNKLKPVVIPTSRYVTLGSDYEAQVFISATDTTQKLSINVNGAELPIDDSGKGIYKVKASSVGEKKWGGVISLKAPDGTTVPYKFDDSYTVDLPNVIVSPTAVNVMYAGIFNPIDVSVPGVSPDKIKITVVNGVKSTDKVKNSKGENFKGSWSVKPNAVGVNVQIIVTADINGKPMTFDPYPFRVKPVPTPIAVFAQKSTGSIPKATAEAQQGVFAILPDFDFDLPYTVTGFNVLYSDSRGDFDEPSSGSNFTSKQKDLIKRLTRGKYLTIKDIKALGPDGKTKELQPIVLKID